jgi:hypothetical protein
MRSDLENLDIVMSFECYRDQNGDLSLKYGNTSCARSANTMALPSGRDAGTMND